jgi:aminoglycoside phosphotransferase (APT) family kinase protein
MAPLMPAADVDITTGLVRGLVADQHPDLAGLPVEFMANGWDNALFRVGPRLVARLPRRAQAAPVLLNEQRWLSSLAARLPLPIPAPERTGVPASGYPWSWSLVPYLPGTSAADVSSFDMTAAAAAVGGFLRALHVAAPPDAPENPFRGVWLGEREPTVLENLRTVADQVDEAAALRVWSAAVAAPRHSDEPVWVHGDLHPGNILVDEGQVSGVIDFGDLTAGDPATDLSVAWMLLPLPAHEAFFSASGAAYDAALRARARGWALALGLVFLTFSADNPRMLAIGKRTLRRVLGVR